MTTRTKRAPLLALAISLAAIALMGATLATQALAATHFDAKVLSKDSQSKTFRADTQNHGIIRFHTNAGTEYERIRGGFSGIERGMRLEVTAKRSSGHWLALVVERDRAN
jgi:hypothetical protein